MGTDRLDLVGWQISYDRAATAAVYAKLPKAGPDSCRCDMCRNWVQSRNELFPPEFRALLDRLGISFDREVEVYHNGRLESGLHFYAGWYHFIGHVLYGEQEGSPNVAFGAFSVLFHSSPALLSEAFQGLPVAQLEFEARVPWLSDISEVD